MRPLPYRIKAFSRTAFPCNGNGCGHKLSGTNKKKGTAAKTVPFVSRVESYGFTLLLSASQADKQQSRLCGSVDIIFIFLRAARLD